MKQIGHGFYVAAIAVNTVGKVGGSAVVLQKGCPFLLPNWLTMMMMMMKAKMLMRG